LKPKAQELEPPRRVRRDARRHCPDHPARRARDFPLRHLAQRAARAVPPARGRFPGVSRGRLRARPDARARAEGLRCRDRRAARGGVGHDPGASAALTFDASGRILRDNIYGTIDEDVWRRDFTANALYYNIADFSVWDYVDGAQDIAARTLKLIGDPETRFRE